MTPAYNRPTQEGLYRHFAAVAAAATVPVDALQRPVATAVDLLPATVARLAKLPRIVAVKEAVALGGSACVEADQALPGEGSPCFRAMMRQRASRYGHGARGVISVTANVVPEAMALMVAAALRGDQATARATGCARCAGAARGAVRRGQSDSGQVGAGADGPDRGGHPPAADRHCAKQLQPARCAPRSQAALARHCAPARRSPREVPTRPARSLPLCAAVAAAAVLQRLLPGCLRGSIARPRVRRSSCREPKRMPADKRNQRVPPLEDPRGRWTAPDTRNAVQIPGRSSTPDDRDRPQDPCPCPAVPASPARSRSTPARRTARAVPLPRRHRCAARRRPTHP